MEDYVFENALLKIEKIGLELDNYFLENQNSIHRAIKEWGTHDIMNELDTDEICEYINNEFAISDVFNWEDIIEYVTDRANTNEMLDNLSEYDIKEYVVNNYDVSDWTSTEWY